MSAKDLTKELPISSLPDCRLRGTNKDNNFVMNYHYGRLWEKVYCANCHKLDGLVTADWAARVFCLCNECALKHGNLPYPEVPKDQCLQSS
jgi:hypothetical protein